MAGMSTLKHEVVVGGFLGSGRNKKEMNGREKKGSKRGNGNVLHNGLAISFISIFVSPVPVH